MPSRTTRLGIALACDRLMPSWPLLLGLAAFARAITDPARLLADPDSYLHIAAGRWMLGHQALPLADPFSHSMAGAAWLPHEWLAEIALAAAFAPGGCARMGPFPDSRTDRRAGDALRPGRPRPAVSPDGDAGAAIDLHRMAEPGFPQRPGARIVDLGGAVPRLRDRGSPAADPRPA